MRLTLAALLTVVGLAGPAASSPIDPDAVQLARRDGLASRLPGARVLWVRQNRILHSRVDAWTEEVVSEAGQEESNPRFSPDGRQILFVRAPGSVWVMDADYSNKRRVIDSGTTASWTRDGTGITAIAGDGYRALRHDLQSGDTDTIYDARDAPYNGQKISQAAELRVGGRYLLVFRLTPGHVT